MKAQSIKLEDGEAFCESDGSICITSNACESVFIKYCDLLFILRTVEKLMNERDI